MSVSGPVMDQLAVIDPWFAKERRKNERRRRAWQRERDKLCNEVSRLQIPFAVALLHDDAELRDISLVMLDATDWLFEQDAPAQLIRDLLRVTERLVSK